MPNTATEMIGNYLDWTVKKARDLWDAGYVSDDPWIITMPEEECPEVEMISIREHECPDQETARR